MGVHHIKRGNTIQRRMSIILANSGVEYFDVDFFLGGYVCDNLRTLDLSPYFFEIQEKRNHP